MYMVYGVFYCIQLASCGIHNISLVLCRDLDNRENIFNYGLMLQFLVYSFSYLQANYIFSPIHIFIYTLWWIPIGCFFNCRYNKFRNKNLIWSCYSGHWYLPCITFVFVVLKFLFDILNNFFADFFILCNSLIWIIATYCGILNIQHGIDVCDKICLSNFIVA